MKKKKVCKHRLCCYLNAGLVLNITGGRILLSRGQTGAVSRCESRLDASRLQAWDRSRTWSWDLRFKDCWRRA